MVLWKDLNMKLWYRSHRNPSMGPYDQSGIKGFRDAECKLLRKVLWQ